MTEKIGLSEKNPSAEVIFRVDQCHYLSTCTLTPPPTQLHSTDNKLGLIFFYGRVRCAVDYKILTLTLNKAGYRMTFSFTDKP